MPGVYQKDPAGWPTGSERTEVIEREIVVAPTWSGHLALIPDELLVTDRVTVTMTATGERYLPDLLVAPEGALRREWLPDPADVEPVAEIVSPFSSRHDRVGEVHGYAVSAVPFGVSVALPEPYSGKVDTGVFA
jgi:hypothetical protein